MIRLWIKGSVEEAKQAAQERNIPIHEARQLLVENPTVLAQTDDIQSESVLRWFDEDPSVDLGNGYPSGTLLLYSSAG
jgi:hypothetical protein